MIIGFMLNNIWAWHQAQDKFLARQGNGIKS